MAQKVTIALELDWEFVKLLWANVQLSILDGGEVRKRLDPMHVLALVAACEAKGAPTEQTWSKIPIEWRPHIDVVGDLRKVETIDEPTPVA